MCAIGVAAHALLRALARWPRLPCHVRPIPCCPCALPRAQLTTSEAQKLRGQLKDAEEKLSISNTQVGGVFMAFYGSRGL